MYDDVDDVGTEKHRQLRNTLRILGLIIFPIGAILTIGGFLIFAAPIFSEEPSMDYAGIGFFMFLAGGIMSTIGFGMLGWGFQGKIAKYSARETKDAVTIAGDGAGEGLARGIGRSGGIKLNLRNSGPRDIVKIRCRKCGYLDSEDAKFCSKCGSKI